MRISTWPLDDAADAPTELWTPGRIPEALAAITSELEDTDATRRYSASSAPPVRPSQPSIIPSLEPPPPYHMRPNPFGEAPLTGTGKVALMPPRGDAHALDPIPPSPAVPDFRPSSRIPWAPLFLGLVCALLGILGYQFWPVPATDVHLEIVSAPTGAAVRLDGRLQNGKTPLRLSGLGAGKRYALAVELPGYQPWLSDYIAGRVSVQQIAVLHPITRTLTITSTPAGATVFMGDTLVGRTPLSLPSVQVETKLALRLELPGYETMRREINLERSEANPSLSVALRAQP